MKQRMISGTVISIITLVSVLLGGYLFYAVCAFIAVWGSYEFTSTRNRPINWLEYAFMLIYILLVNVFYDKVLGITLCLVIAYLGLAVFDRRIKLADSAISVIESIILAFSIYQMIEIEHLNKWMFGYIVIIAYLTDVFALFIGIKFGKHKLNERISPKKTVEGAIGGWLCGAIISFAWSYFFNYFGLGCGTLAVCSLVLPIVSQIGDLTFSLIKRSYDIKDFSKLIPGHGGLLDRLDSLTFVLITIGAILIFLR